MAASTSLVTAAPLERKEIAASNGSRLRVDVVNNSGADVKIYYGSDTVPADIIPGAPADKAKKFISGNDAQLAVSALCETAKLAVNVTLVT